MADRVDERLTALEQEMKQLKARFDASERDRQSEMAELQSDNARLGADLASGLSGVKKDMATVIRRLGAIETQLGAIEAQLDDWPDKIGQLVREIVQETMRKP
jgi:septal ring factor EnvC (AmiA/AmiB activator)